MSHINSIAFVGALLAQLCVPTATADDLPTLELTSLFPSYGNAVPLSLLVRVSLPSNASHGWTVTRSTEGTLHVAQILQSEGSNPLAELSKLGPSQHDSRPDSSLEAQQLDGRQLLAPGQSIELPIAVVREEAGFAIATFSRAVPPPADMRATVPMPPVDRRATILDPPKPPLDQKATIHAEPIGDLVTLYRLMPGHTYTLTLRYEIPSTLPALSESEPVSPAIESNAVSFRVNE